MEGQPNSDQFYLSQNWTPVARRNTYAATSPLSPSNIAPAQHFPSPLEQLSSLLPQQSAQFNAQLEHYNKLIESGGRASRGQSSPQPPYFSSGSHHTPSRKSSWNDNSSTRSAPKGHGSKKSPSIGKGERSLMTTEDNIARMAKKSHHDFKGSFPSARNAMNEFSYQSQQSNSVPSTPHQRPRKFSYASREPSPSALPNHSPRSAYSETDSTLPSLRPLPPRLAACKYETAMQHSRRRMAYSIGTERLERVKPDQIKARLTESEERKLATDMRELYDRILPTPRGEANRKKFVEKLEDIMNKEWPGHGIKVHMFGSSGNMLCTDESDGRCKDHCVEQVMLILCLKWIYASRLIPTGRSSTVYASLQSSLLAVRRSLDVTFLIMLIPCRWNGKGHLCQFGQGPNCQDLGS